jgi:AraC-like DNA-binding protein
MAASVSAQTVDSRVAFFSTLDAAERERADYWNGITARYFGPLETRALGDAEFRASLATRQVAFLRTFNIVGTGHQVERRRSNGGTIPDAIKLLLQVRGHCRIEQGGRGADLQPGAWCVYDSWQPYGITNFGDVEQIVIQIPRDRVIDRNFQRLDGPFLADPGRSAMAQIAGSFIHSCADPALVPDYGDEFLAETTVGFVRRALHASLSPPSATDSSASRLRSRVRQYILQHLSDPSLSIDGIARAMGCSKRYLHHIFAAEDLSLERHIWRLRIERCCEALQEADQREKSISAIAFEWGFNSSAHFSRLFKAQIGVAPIAFRQGGLRQAP